MSYKGCSTAQAADYGRVSLALVLLCFFSGCLNADLEFTALDTNQEVLALDPSFQVSQTLTAGQAVAQSPKVMIQNSVGRVLNRDFSISLYAYSDLQCQTFITGNSNSLGQVSTAPSEDAARVGLVKARSGVATFAVNDTTRAGTYYLKAIATNSSGERVMSPCSAPVMIQAGPASKVIPLSTNPCYLSSTCSVELNGVAINLGVQIADQFGNAVSTPVPIPVAFAAYTPGAGAGGVGNVLTNAQGQASVNFATTAAMAPVAAITATALGTTAILPVPITGVSAAAPTFVLDFLPSRIILGDSQYVRVRAVDPANVDVPSFTGNVGLSSSGIGNAVFRAFTSLDRGIKYATVAMNAAAPVTAFFSAAAAGVSGAAPVATDPTTIGECGVQLLSVVGGGTLAWPAGLGATWRTILNIPSIAPIAGVNRGTIQAGSDVNLNAAVGGASCVDVSGALSLTGGATLTISNAEFKINQSVAQFTSDANSKIVFNRNGVGAQRLHLENWTGTVNEVQVTPTNFGAASAYAFYLNAGSGVNSTSLGKLTLTVDPQGNSYKVYLNGNISIATVLQIPAGIEVVVNPDAKLTLSNGAAVNGTLTVRGGATVNIAAGRTLQVTNGGALNLLGAPGSSVLIQVSSSEGKFTIQNDGTLNANHFRLVGLGINANGNQGLETTANGTITQLDNGVFEGFDGSKFALSLRSNVAGGLPRYFFNLQFKDTSGLSNLSVMDFQNPARNSLGMIASTLFSSGTQQSLKSAVNDPTAMLMWDH